MTSATEAESKAVEFLGNLIEHAKAAGADELVRRVLGGVEGASRRRGA